MLVNLLMHMYVQTVFLMVVGWVGVLKWEVVVIAGAFEIFDLSYTKFDLIFYLIEYLKNNYK